VPWYSVPSGKAIRLPTDETLTMVPLRFVRKWGRRAWVVARRPSTFTSNCRRIFSIGVASSGPYAPWPALFTSASIGPNFARAASTVGDQHALELRELGLLIRRSHCRDDIPALRVEVLGRGRPWPLDVHGMRMVLFVWCSFLNTNVRSSGIVYTGGLRHSAIRLRQGISADNR
jgi:hypothetical protein